MPYEDFEQLLSRYTAQQNINGKKRNLFLGINNAVREVSRTDAMFWGFAEETPEFILGCPEFWEDELEDKHAGIIEKHQELKKVKR